MTIKKGTGNIRAVANATGVSVATVSRVMNGAQNVSEKTREKVLLAARNLSYIPNPAARALSTNRSYTIAAIVPTFEHSIFARFLTTLEETLKARNYSIVVAVSQWDLEEELRLTENLIGLGAEGFVYSGIERHPDLLGTLERRNLPCVFTSCWAPQLSVPTIGYDNTVLARDAVEYLYGMGHRSIAILHGPAEKNDRTQARLAGAKSAKAPNLLIEYVETELSAHGGAKAVKGIFKRSETNPTAVLAFSDVLALGAMFELGRLGIDIPRDVSVMGFDNFEWSATANPPLTTIDLPTRAMARRSANAMIDHIENGVAIEPVNMEGKIVERATVAPPPHKIGD